MTSHDTATTYGPLQDTSFDHGARSRFNAWFFDTFDRYLNHALRSHKDAAFTGLTGPVVVEIGAGTGANLTRLPAGTELIGVEPNRQMHNRLRNRAATTGVRLQVLPCRADDLPMPDGSVDDVLCSLVLCTVEDLEGTLAEVRRVLRPGGRFRFVEHVAAPRRSPRRRLQESLRRPWGWVFEGCDPARETVRHVEAAGFSELTVVPRKLRHSVFFPVNTAVWGVATR
jgi:ubiquinone/menaquinone biosynthesis C-methylase UbiE